MYNFQFTTPNNYAQLPVHNVTKLCTIISSKHNIDVQF